MQFIDLKAQYRQIEDKIKSRINTVLEHAKFIMGPEVLELEEKLSNYVGSTYAISVSSGTDALLIALMALDIGKGDEVIIPDFSFYATAEVVSLLGATPVFVDVDSETYNISISEIKKNITSNTKVIMPVSLYGQCADFDEINEIASKQNIAVIEDGCQSFGATYKGKKSGNLSLIGCTSFFPSKPLGCYGDGGAIFTSDKKLYEKMKSIRVHGQVGRYNHPNLGVNGRLDTIQAAILLEKLEIFDKELELRQEVAAKYIEQLKGKYTLPKIHEHNTSAWAQFTILSENRDNLIENLKMNGIPTACHYPKPISKQPYYAGKTTAKCQISNDLSNKVLSIPIHPYLVTSNMKDLELIISTLLNQAT